MTMHAPVNKYVILCMFANVNIYIVKKSTHKISFIVPIEESRLFFMSEMYNITSEKTGN